MSQKIWLRVKLPENELASLQQEFSDCDLRTGDDSALDPQWLARVDGVFTEETVPDEIVRRMTRLRWLHVTRGGVNAYLTPAVRARPIQVTGSKGIHGTVFSEFALACIFIMFGVVTSWITSVVGALLFVVSLVGWIGDLRHDQP